MNSVQEVIESLAQDLQRSIAVDDPDLNLLASSSHFGDADDARLGSLIARRVEGARRDYIFGYGVRSWRAPRRMAAIPELGAVRPRMCFPLWSRFALLGFIWVIEAEPLSEKEMSICADAADTVRGLLALQAQTASEDARQIEAQVLSLVSGDLKRAASAAAELADRGIFHETKVHTVLAMVVDDEWNGSPEEPTPSMIRRAIAHVQASRTSGTMAAGIGETESVIVLGSPVTPTPDDLATVGMRFHAELARIDPTFAARVRIGVGTPRSTMSEMPSSFSQALHAAHLAKRHGATSEVWGSDPLGAMLGSVLRATIDHRELPDLVQRLGNLESSTLNLLEIYLDQGGNAIGTAERMQMHRTSVYYHLDRIEKKLRLDLKDGQVRLLVHLWLKIRHRLL